MNVRVEYTGQVRSAAGRDVVAAELDAGATLGDLMATLAATGPEGLRPHLLTAAGRIQPTLVVVIDGRAVAGTAREATALHDGAAVVLLPPVAGG
jgi:molybdopterin converting factor small subunit